jgi:catechol-2,3-dioxygenase
MAPNFSQPGSKVLSPSKLAHVVLRTNNFTAQVSFYTDFLGAHIVYQNPYLCFITYDSEHHRVAIVSIPEISAKVRSSCGLEHFAFTFDSLTDLLMAYRQRKEKGILPFWCINHGPTISLYYKDADRNIVETQTDCFEKPEMATEFMLGEEYKVNPIGVDVDPEELIRKIEEGVSESELIKRGNVGPRGVHSVPE